MNWDSCTGGCFTGGKKARVAGVLGPWGPPTPSTTGRCYHLSCDTPGTAGSLRAPLPGQAPLLALAVSGFAHQGTVPTLLTPSKMLEEMWCLPTHTALPVPSTEPGIQQVLNSYRGINPAACVW